MSRAANFEPAPNRSAHWRGRVGVSDHAWERRRPIVNVGRLVGKKLGYADRRRLT